MSKLDDLIKELCPNGVETVRLQDVAHYSTDRISAISVDAQHYVGVDNQLPNKLGKTDSSYVPVTGRPVGFKAGDVLIGNIRPYLKKIWLADIAGGTNGDVLVIRSNNKNELLPKYLYYILSSETFFLYATQNSKGAKMPRGNKDSVMQYKLQVPPLPIQVEIVHILDNFTELTARKKQYSYYRDRLLSQSEPEGKFLKIEDICENISSGGTPQAGNSDYYGGSIPWLRTQEIDWRDICDTEIKITDAGLEQSSAKWIPENCVIVAMYGATAAKVAINKIPLTTNQACCNLQIDSTKANYRYVFHWLSNKYEELKALGQGSQSNINAKIVRNFPILVPSLDVQTRLVEVLDNFDAICSDLNIGLPAEIEARQKQYEYYRDALLTYAATGKIIDSTVQYSTETIMR